MNSIAVGVSSVAYIVCLIVFRKNTLVQQVAFAIVYIAAVTFVGNLDVVLPIFFVVSFFPFVRSIAKVRSWTFFLLAYLLIYLIIGIMFQNASRSIVMFISRCWQFAFFFVVFDGTKLSDNKTINEETIRIKTLLTCVCVAEVVLASYLYLTKRGLYSVVRLTSGAQPITGNLSVIILPVLLYFYYAKNKETSDQTKLLIVLFLFAAFVGLSGTRGYELVYAVSLLLIIWNYVFKTSDSKNASTRFVLFAILSIVLFSVLFIFPTYFERVFTVLRLNKRSIGIRGYENSAGLEFMLNAPISVQLFGVGMGGKLGNYPAYLDAIYKQFSLGMWNQKNYLNGSGALFHNLYLNILCNLGLLGCVVFGVSIVKIWNVISKSVNEKKLRLAYRLFFVSFLVMNYYRWSADCGIAIMSVFATMLKYSSEYETDNMVRV